jgi:hypothetical protein
MTCHTERESNRGGCDAVVIDRVTLDLQDPPSPYSPATPATAVNDLMFIKDAPIQLLERALRLYAPGRRSRQ